MANTDYTASSSSISDLLHRLLRNLPFNVTAADVPDVSIPPNTDINPFSKFMAEAEEADLQSWGVIVNSFFELEIDHIPPLESFYSNGAEAWCIGPTSLYGQQTNASKDATNHHNEDHTISLMNWLDARAVEAEPASPVIYAAFGTQAVLTDAQLDAVALGLEESGCPFVLVIRSNTWCAPKEIGSKGMIVRRFVDQIGVLFHSAIGGFLSHCGWNSVTESLAAAVPILAWPMMAEQKLNAKYVVEGLGIGIGMEREENGDLFVSPENISASVRELMVGEGGQKARERVGELGMIARRAVEDGGSSYATLKKLLLELGSYAQRNCEETKDLNDL